MGSRDPYERSRRRLLAHHVAEVTPRHPNCRCVLTPIQRRRPRAEFVVAVAVVAMLIAAPLVLALYWFALGLLPCGPPGR